MNVTTNPFMASAEHIGSITQAGNAQVFGLTCCPITHNRKRAKRPASITINMGEKA